MESKRAKIAADIKTKGLTKKSIHLRKTTNKKATRITEIKVPRSDLNHCKINVCKFGKGTVKKVAKTKILATTANQANQEIDSEAKIQPRVTDAIKSIVRENQTCLMKFNGLEIRRNCLNGTSRNALFANDTARSRKLKAKIFWGESQRFGGTNSST